LANDTSFKDNLKKPVIKSIGSGVTADDVTVTIKPATTTTDDSLDSLLGVGEATGVALEAAREAAEGDGEKMEVTFEVNCKNATQAAKVEQEVAPSDEANGNIRN
jgi:hypothetical protein